MYNTIQVRNKIKEKKDKLVKVDTSTIQDTPKVPKINLNTYQEDYPTIFNILNDNHSFEPSLSETIMEQELKNQVFSQPQIPNIKLSLKSDLKNIQLFQQLTPESLNELIDGPLTVKYGTPCCLVTNGIHLILGTEKGYVYAINLQQQSQNVTFVDANGKEHRYQLLDLVSPQSNNPNILKLSFDIQEQILCVGYATGSLLFVNFQKPSKQKMNKDSHQNKIIALQNIGHKLWISCDLNNHVFIHRLEKGMFSFDLDSQELLSYARISTISVLKSRYQDDLFPESKQKNFLLKDTTGKPPKEEDYIVIAIASELKCWIIRVLDYKNAQVLAVIENYNPQIKDQHFDSILSWVATTENLILCICWGQTMDQYKLERNTTEIQINLEFSYSMPTQMLLMRCDNKNIITLIDQRGMVSIFSFLTKKIINIFQVHLNKFQVCINEEQKEIFLYNQKLVIVKEYSFSEIHQKSLENNDLETCQQILLLGKLLSVDEKIFNDRLVEFVSRKVQAFMRKYFCLIFRPTAEYLSQLIQVMIQLQEENILYKQVFITVTQFMNDKGSFFLNCLTKFIQNKQITYIPEQQLVTIMDGLIQGGQQDLLEILLTTLDLSKTNQSLIMHYCMENSLFKPLICLCTQPGANDFLTPMFQLQTYYTKHFNLKEYNQCCYYGRRSQAYMMLCLQDVKPQQAEMLFDFLFQENILTQYTLIDPQSCFQILNKVFFLTTVNLIEFTHKKNLELIIDVVKRNNKYDIQKYFTLFILQILFKLKLQVSEHVLLQVVKFILDFPEIYFLIDPIIFFECIDKQTFILIPQDSGKSQILHYIHQKFLLQIVKKIKFEDILPLSPQLYEIELVASYIYTTQIEYEPALNKFLSSSNILIKKSVFQWLEDLLEKQQPHVMELVVQKLIELVRLDVEKTRKIVKKSQKDWEIKIIEQLNKFPQMQLEYLDHIISLNRRNRKNQKNQVISDTETLIMKQHISIISELAPHRLLEELRHNDYPLDEVLNLSKKLENLEVQAYVREREGFIYEAIMIHLDLLQNIFDQILQRINQFEEVPQDYYGLANTKINQIMDICLDKNIQTDTSEDNWYSFLDIFIDNSIKLDKNDPKQAVAYKLIYKKLDCIFQQITLHTPLDIFIQSLDERYGQLKIYELRETFCKIMFNFYYQKNFLHNISSFLKEGFKDDFLHGFQQHQKGHPVYAFCDYCQKNLQDDVPIIFYCGHQIHWQCNSDPYEQRCKICQLKDFDLYENLAKNKKKKMRQLVNQQESENRSSSILAINNKDLIKPPLISSMLTDVKTQRITHLQQFDLQRGARLKSQY